MIDSTLQRLNYLCDIIPPLLRKKSEPEMSHKPSPLKWSKKQILGHLIDSVANNHHRFVRGQFEQEPEIFYDADLWNSHGYYNSVNAGQLVSMWEAYNRQIAALVSSIPPAKLQNKVRTGKESHTLDFLIKDYVVHLEHHLHQLVEY
jgi:hypothetical protein